MNLRTGQKISGKSRKRDYEKEKWSKRHSDGFRKWLMNSDCMAISVLMTGYSVLKEAGDVLLGQAKAWMEEGIDGARDEAGDDGDVASDKKCGGSAGMASGTQSGKNSASKSGGTSAAETPEDGFWGTEIPVYQGNAWDRIKQQRSAFLRKRTTRRNPLKPTASWTALADVRPLMQTSGRI